MKFTTVLSVLLLIIISICFFYTQSENTALSRDLQEIKDSHDKLISKEKVLTETVSNLTEEQFQIVERVEEIEETVNPKSILNTKIKKIRKAIYFSTDENNKLKYNIFDLTDISSSILAYSYKYDIPVSLVLAMMKQESLFQRDAISRVGAIGLMQVMPHTAKEIASELKKKDFTLTSIDDNVHFGVFYISKMIRKYKGDIKLALCAYNAGPEYTNKVINNIYEKFPNETDDYLENILRFKEEYESMGIL